MRKPNTDLFDDSRCSQRGPDAPLTGSSHFSDLFKVSIMCFVECTTLSYAGWCCDWTTGLQSASAPRCRSTFSLGVVNVWAHLKAAVQAVLFERRRRWCSEFAEGKKDASPRSQTVMRRAGLGTRKAPWHPVPPHRDYIGAITPGWMRVAHLCVCVWCALNCFLSILNTDKMSVWASSLFPIF